MKCPHCLEAFFPTWDHDHLDKDKSGDWFAATCICPSCARIAIYLTPNLTEMEPGTGTWQMVWPKGMSRAPLSPEVPEEFAGDYKEACLVLADSPKASAALSRRCLQHVFREHAKVKHPSLSQEIDEAMLSLPSHLAEAIDAVRNIGNFAAHPLKDTSTGEIVDVEPGEAEWLLEVLEGLFDHYFVQPAVLQKKRQTLNAKLKAAGKPEMK